MKLRSGNAWMPAGEYAHRLKALTVNLLVREIDAAIRFQRRVLGARILYSDPDIAVVAGYGAEWMFHADHTYQGHPLAASLMQAPLRGAGIELRVHGCDPDAAAAAAWEAGYRVLAEPTNAGHGLREVLLCDADGYVWVPDIPTCV